MQKEFNYTVGGVSYRGIAKRADLSWGNGLAIKTFDTRGEPRDLVTCVCHPEFDGFDELQNKSTEELLALAIDMLNSGEFEKSLQSAREVGMTLVFRLNDAFIKSLEVR